MTTERRQCMAAGGLSTPPGDRGKHQDLVFQAVSWHAGDEEDPEADEAQTKLRYAIKAFGVLPDGRSVGLSVRGFTPFFYVKVPPNVSAPAKIQAIVASLREMGAEAKAGMVDVRAVSRKDFWGFTNGIEFAFVRLTFASHGGMRKMMFRLRDKAIFVRGAGVGVVRLALYEANIDPLLRFFHIRDLQPAGWMRVAACAHSATEQRETSCELDVECPWRSVQPEQRDEVAPLLMASFDLECNSAHGDFPMAVKDYRKLAIELEQAWERSTAPIRGMNAYDAGLAVLEMLSIAFGNRAAPPFSPVSALHLKKPGAKAPADAALKAVVDDLLAVLRGDKDARLSRLVDALNEEFGGRWPLEGDEIIQIGTTVNVYGQRECCARYVYVLGTCEDVPGAVTMRFDSEKDLLLAWQRLVHALDPDVVMGYNIFGFDMSYMHERAKELRCDGAFMRFGRIEGLPSAYVEQNLSSSALGDNVLKLVEMQGRIVIDLMKVVQRDHKLDSYKLDAVASHFIGQNKNDVSPNDIFRLQRGSAADRRVIAEYCVQDCELCNQLATKLEIVANNVGMANVCSVPLSYIFMRGQGVKIFSLVARQCRDDGFLVPTRAKPTQAADEDDGYEGAIVLEPETGMYLEDPVTVLDYNSLYPSSMISENLSHDSLVLDSRYDNLPGVEYVDVRYDNYAGAGDEKRRTGETVCRFAQTEGKAVLPRILMRLLGARKATRKRMEHVVFGDVKGAYEARTRTLTPADGVSPPLELTEAQAAELLPAYNAFQKAVLDGLQLAYKVTANSLYGQMGARTSALYLKDIAACTTAVGRSMITKAKEFIETSCGGRVVYGDTDSIFIVFRNAAPDGSALRDKDALASSIRQGQAASAGIKPLLKAPHNLEYEKTMFPLLLLSKKRYVGLLYEDDPNRKPKQKSMGIALKRRDYAPIVKTIYGGIIDIILHRRDIPAAVAFLRERLDELAAGHVALSELVISKTLRSYYKLPHQIAHWVLSRRMFDRDPGSAPQTNDRIPYVFVESTKKDALMGDRIEHIDHVRRLGLRVDTKTYIENQIQKPCVQLLAIALEKLPGYRYCSEADPTALAALVEAKKGNLKKAKERLETLREREVHKLIFEPVLVSSVFKDRDNRCARQHSITEFLVKPRKT